MTKAHSPHGGRAGGFLPLPAAYPRTLGHEEPVLSSKVRRQMQQAEAHAEVKRRHRERRGSGKKHRAKKLNADAVATIPDDSSSASDREPFHGKYTTALRQKAAKQGARLGSRTLQFMEAFVDDIVDQVASESAALALRKGKQTIGSSEMRAAISRMLHDKARAQRSVGLAERAVARLKSSKDAGDDALAEAPSDAAEGAAADSDDCSSAVSV